VDMMVYHMEKMCKYKGMGAIREGRTHLLFHLHNIEGGRPLKKIASKAETIEDIYNLKKELLS